jgi:HEAT repeat protein
MTFTRGMPGIRLPRLTWAAPAVPALVGALRDEHIEVRLAAAAALGRIGPAAAEAIPALTALLEQSDERFKNTIRSAIEKISPPWTEHTHVYFN